ncbi:unnamed protein product, partial [marine sediment metagenome]
MKNLLPYTVAALALAAMVAYGAPNRGVNEAAYSVVHYVTNTQLVTTDCGLLRLVIVTATAEAAITLPTDAPRGTVCNITAVANQTINV